MEVIRLVDHNSRRAEHYEPGIREQIGDGLYLRLSESTKRTLNVAEYLYKLSMSLSAISRRQ